MDWGQRHWRATAAASALLIVVGVMSGCASTPAPTTEPSATPSPSASVEPSAPAAEEWKLGPNGECDAGQLEAALESRPEDSGAGSFYWNLSFTNTSDVECSLTGPPSMVYLVDAATGDPIGAGAGSEDPYGVGEQTVPLAPGAAAFSLLHLTQAGAYGCEMVTVNALAVSPPHWDATRDVATPNEIEGCNDPSIELVKAGPVSATVQGP